MGFLKNYLAIPLLCIFLFAQCDEGEDLPIFFNLVIVNTTPYDLLINFTHNIQTDPYHPIGFANAIMTTKLDEPLFHNTGYFLQAIDEDNIERGSLFFFNDDEKTDTYEWIIFP